MSPLVILIEWLCEPKRIWMQIAIWSYVRMSEWVAIKTDCKVHTIVKRVKKCFAFIQYVM